MQDNLRMRGNRDLIFLRPEFKQTVWGGTRLRDELGYDAPKGRVGECWAISAHPSGDCVVASGAYAGETLSSLWEGHRELFGGMEGDRFPLLVKVLDAAEDLSVQVHPGDAYAREHEGGQLGKHECWYVLDAEPGTQIVVGQTAHSREELARMAADGAWDALLNRVPIVPGSFFDIVPGTVHAICGGTLLVEIQQSSDVTYRVYDYDRRDAEGNLRELHMEKALDVIDYEQRPPVRGAVCDPEGSGDLPLLESSDFSVDLLRTSGEEKLPQPWPFLCVSVCDGAGFVLCGGTRHALARGDHFIAPYGCGDLELTGEMTLLTAHV